MIKLPWKPNAPITVDRLQQMQDGSVRQIIGQNGIRARAIGRDRYVVELENPNTQLLTFPALLYDSVLIAGHQARWQYSFCQCRYEIDADGVITTTAMASGGIRTPAAPTASGYAYNTIELAHVPEPAVLTPWYVWGIDCHDYTIAAQLIPQAVGGGSALTATHKVSVPLEITRRVSTLGKIFYTFESVGSIEAVC